MITLNTIKYNNDTGNIDVDVSTSTGETLTKVYLWVGPNFDSSDNVFDLSSYIDPQTENQVFSITPEDLNVEHLNDIYFIRFMSDDPNTNYSNDCFRITEVVGVTGTLTKYHNFLIEQLLEVDLDDCNLNRISNFDCGKTECDVNLYYFNALLNNTYRALKCGYFKEASLFLESLDDMKDCSEDCGCQEDICGLIYTENNKVIL